MTDLQHALFGLSLEGNLHLAPIGPNPQNVLDFATGKEVAFYFCVRVGSDPPSRYRDLGN